MIKYCLLFVSVFNVYMLSAQNNSVMTPAENLVIRDIPAIPASIAREVKSYSESRSAVFVGWHPIKTEMLISTRFGNVPQLHQVKNPMGARKQITFFDEPIAGASYEPLTGKYFVFSKDMGGNEFAQLYRYDVATGKSTLLTDGGRSQNGNIEWSNNGKWMAYTSTRRNGADRDIYIMDPVNPSTDKLVLQVQGGGWSISDWSIDDSKLLLREGISANESHLWLLDIAAATKTEVTDRKETDVAWGSASFSKDGKSIWVLTDKDNEFTRLALMDLTTKKITYITNNIPWDIENFRISKDRKKIAFTSNEAGLSKLYMLNTANLQYKKVDKIPVGVIANFQFHRSNKDLAISINTSQTPTDVYVLQTETGQLVRWTESEMGGLMADELTIPTLVKWKSFDGKEISGFYYKPSAKFTGKRPVIINIHGGPEGQARPTFSGSTNFFTNELGIAIIYPNVRGSLGYGKTFLKADNGYKREESVKDIGTLLDWIAQQPDLDASRVMVTGGSYGGYMTLAVATHYNDKIRCALDVVGISNFNTFLKNTESYRRDLRRVEYGDERDADMAAFLEKISPLNNAAKITKPLFIVQGGNDPRVPRTEAVQMADKVKQNGGTVWYLEAKDEGHGFRKKNNVDFQLYCTVLFVKSFLIN